MPLASGLGSSGASSAAGAVAANEMLGRPLSPRDVVLSAMEGECAASGTPHADNVAPSVMGGIVLVRSYDPFEMVELPVPDGLRIAVVHPHCQVSTAEARRLVKERTYGLDVIVPNIGSVAALVAALYRGDLPLLGRSIDDRIIEPLRATLIPGFAAVKNAASARGRARLFDRGLRAVRVRIRRLRYVRAAHRRGDAGGIQVGRGSRQRSVLGKGEHRRRARDMSSHLRARAYGYLRRASGPTRWRAACLYFGAGLLRVSDFRSRVSPGGRHTTTKATGLVTWEDEVYRASCGRQTGCF